MKKPSIPAPLPPVEEALRKVLSAIKENIEIVEGRGQHGKIARLGSAATLDDVINKINELLDRLQD